MVSSSNQLKICLRDPISEIAEAALLLNQAVDAHAAGDYELAAALIREADNPAVRAWTESLWGSKSPYAPKPQHPPRPSLGRAAARIPSAALQAELHRRDGYHCRFCGIPVIRKRVREYFRQSYPHLPIWGRRNCEQHAALQAMWVQYDHIIPHSRGGENDLRNLVVTCAPCNYARMECTLEEAMLSDPRAREPIRSSWDGLERLLKLHPTPAPDCWRSW